MKIKDIERTANVAWSPKSHCPIYLAAGTAAQQFDASFNTNAALELYALNITEPGLDTQLVSTLPSEQRFHKIIWGPAPNNSSGTIIGGCNDGILQIYNASKLLAGEEALITKLQKHSGAIKALDFNHFQQNLFASGAGDSEIFIWDLQNISTPMSPGAKSQPFEDVSSVAWNKKVQHILASSLASKCVIWDLRKNEPIMKLADTNSRIRWKMVEWHPDVATQLCLASDEDHSPVIQLWDLRFATSPLKTLENHQRGVLAIAWCNEDANLLVSCGKDDRILCWNPNSDAPNGEVLAEIAKTNQWSFDVVWCKKNPALIACPNYDGHVSIYSVMGGKTQQIQTTKKIADSFPGMDGFMQTPSLQQNNIVVSADLTKPPKWMKRPVGASFGFGGKLISFVNNSNGSAEIQQQPGQVLRNPRTVQISQVVTEPEFVKRALLLEEALKNGSFEEYCLNKSNAANDQHVKYIWHFLKANFEKNPRPELLNLLGYNIEDVNNKLSQHIKKPVLQNINDSIEPSNRIEDYNSNEDPFSKIAEQNDLKSKSNHLYKIKTSSDDTEGLLAQALLINNLEIAVEICLQSEKYAEALIIASTGGPPLLTKVQQYYLQKSHGFISNLISAITDKDCTSIIHNCDIANWKEALVSVLTHASIEEFPFLCEQLGNRLEMESGTNPQYAQDAQLCYICSGSFDKLVSSWSSKALSSTQHLQELIELVSVLKKSIERQGIQTELSERLDELFSHYAALLASQGNLQEALCYLETIQDGKVHSLKDRLLTALGQKPNIQEIQQQRGSRSSSNRTSFTNYGTGVINPPNSYLLQNQFNQSAAIPPPQPPPAALPTVPSAMAQQYGHTFNTGLPNPAANNNVQSWQNQAISTVTPAQSTTNQPPKVFSPAPLPITQPPRPDSAGSIRGNSGPLSRKYVLDPSVSNNQYPTRNYAPPAAPNVSSFDSNSLSFNPLNTHNFAQQPVHQQVYQPLQPNPPTVAPLVPNSPLNPPAPSIPTIPFGQLALEETQNYDSQQASGWNDPPVLNRPARQQSKPNVLPPEPITHPIYGSAPQPSEPTGYNPSTFQPPLANMPSNQLQNRLNYSAGFNAPPGASNAVAGIQATIPTGASTNLPSVPINAYNPNNFNQNATVNASYPPLQSLNPELQSAATAPIPPVQKPPIPREYEGIYKTFEGLKEKCYCSTNIPQTRRKLDDVSRRLETLYDALRYNKLSSNTLSTLEQLVNTIQSGDYNQGLYCHTLLVQSADFAQIASFMPGVKILLQLAMQLNIYLD